MAESRTGDRRLEAARRIFHHCAEVIDLPLSLKLWDGSVVPLGRAPDEGRWIAISGPGVLGSLFRRPSLDNLFRHYAKGHIGLHGCDLVEGLEIARRVKKQGKIKLSDLRRGFPWRQALPLLMARESSDVSHELKGAEEGRDHANRSDKEFIQFHYDASNAFYELFLDPEMLYSCAYFTDWGNSLEQAQRDKLDIICRKLRLREGETFLDIGSGWGALICHAAKNYGVKAQGVTLSQAQFDFAQEKIGQMNLGDRVSVALRDYRSLDGKFDKIASIGMYEHVGIDNYPEYFRKIRSLLADDGIFLNHGITRRAKRNIKNFGRLSPGKKIILKYIFPGSELDHIGNTVQVMESCGFEVQDVENLRLHYGRTCRLWHERLLSRQVEAVAQIGPEKTRMWLAYLAGVTGAFEQGPLRVYQTVATKQRASADSPLPPTRSDLYR